MRLAVPRLVRNTGWMLVANAARTFLQAAYFVIVARALGVSGYGAFVAGLALVALVSPFGGLSAGNLIVMHGARDGSELARRWGNSLVLTFSVGVPLTAAVVVIAPLVSASLSPRLIVPLAVAELVMSPICDAAGQTFQALEKLSATAALALLLSGARTVAAATFVLTTSNKSASEWALWYLVATVVAAVASWFAVFIRVGHARPRAPLHAADLRDGSYFSIAQAAVNIYADIDKALVARFTGLAAAGVYGAAYRVVSMAFVPALSLFNAAYARFFRSGAKGISSTVAFGRRLAPFLIVYSAAAGIALFSLAGFAETVLGHGYASAGSAMRWLAPLPMLQSACYLAGDVLTGAGRQGIRSLLQLTTALVNVALGIWLIRGHGWLGAAWATLASYAFLAGSLALAVAIAARRESSTPSTGAAIDTAARA